jgi:hypothetical protein
MSEKLTRQQIYDKIRSSSKDSYILEEMQRLGFWESSDTPSLSEVLIKREVELTKELNTLLEKDRKFSNQEAMLKEMRKERMKKAKEKREQTKLRNKQKRLDKAEKWKQTQLQQISYLGKEVSKGLNNTENNVALLQKYNLPVFSTIAELAEAIGLELAELRYLLYSRKVSKTNHYYTFEIPKKSGGTRKISAPKRKLKYLQTWVLENVLNCVPIGDSAHGFIKNRSIVSNAGPHVGADMVINVDLKDFFPTIDYKRVKGLMEALGYSEQLATIFALICTQSETETVQMDGVTYYVQNGNRFLPQGSPASPAISNLIAYRLDRKVQGLARKMNFTYTRYADDLSFSTSKEHVKTGHKLLYFLKQIIESEGFIMHPEKTQIMRKGGLQKVTGIVVNEKPNVERTQLRKFRSLLHHIETEGWKDQKWGKAKHLINAIEGYICYVSMVNRTKGDLFREQLKKVIEKHGYPVDEQVIVQNKKPVEELFKPKLEEVKSEGQTPKPAQPANTDWWNILS